MNTLNKTSQYFVAIAIAFVVTVGTVAAPIAVYAQADDSNCCADYGVSTSYPDSYDYGVSTSYPDSYDYGVSTSYPNYYDSSYNYGNTASPVYSYGGLGSYTSGGYSLGGSSRYSTGGGYYVAPPTYPTATPHYSYSIAPVGRPYGTPAPVTTSAPASQHQQQSNTSYNSNPNTNTNTNTQNQAPINITNTNINNVPAPVYQAPVQQVVQYTLPYSMPTCTISVSNSYYNSYNNNPVTLTWSSTNAYSAMISPNVGTVNPSGSTTVNPTGGTTIYTMTVHGQGGSGTCQTQVIYQQQPVTTHVPPAHTPYVSLSQIPYTGFDFGPVGNAIYWAGLLSFALAAAYLAIYYKGGLALAGASVGNRRRPVKYEHIVASNDEVVTAEPTAPIATTQSVNGAHSHTTHQAVFANLPTRGEHRNATADNMAIAQPATTDEMPRIIITRA